MINRLQKIIRLPAFWILICILGAGLVSNLSHGWAEDGERFAEFAAADQAKLMREGARVENQPAACRSSGDRLTVEIDENSKLTALENLAAERILKAVLDDGDDQQWIISGEVTQFQGRNFILLDRVTRPAKRF